MSIAYWQWIFTADRFCGNIVRIGTWMDRWMRRRNGRKMPPNIFSYQQMYYSTGWTCDAKIEPRDWLLWWHTLFWWGSVDQVNLVQPQAPRSVRMVPGFKNSRCIYAPNTPGMVCPYLTQFSTKFYDIGTVRKLRICCILWCCWMVYGGYAAISIPRTCI